MMAFSCEAYSSEERSERETALRQFGKRILSHSTKGSQGAPAPFYFLTVFYAQCQQFNLLVVPSGLFDLADTSAQKRRRIKMRGSETPDQREAHGQER